MIERRVAATLLRRGAWSVKRESEQREHECLGRQARPYRGCAAPCHCKHGSPRSSVLERARVARCAREHEPVVGGASWLAPPHENSASPGRRRSPTGLRSRGRQFRSGSHRGGHRYGQRSDGVRWRGERTNQSLGPRRVERDHAGCGRDARGLRRVRARLVFWRRVLGTGRREPLGHRRRSHPRHRGHRLRLRQRSAHGRHPRRGAHDSLGHHRQVTTEEDKQHPGGTAESRQHVSNNSVGRAKSSMSGVYAA